jgi:AmmeMemoRadiSam system protein A
MSEEEKHKEVGIDLGLNKKQQIELLKLARRSILARFESTELQMPEDVSGVLSEERGAFVTLNLKGRLRGCIGHIVGNNPLVETVATMALAAAFEDPRFPPLDRSELDDVEIEISVMTPLKRLENTEDIVIGRDGLIIRKGMYQGLLLPQVATSYGWDREEFLDHTCLKAGLPPGSWKDSDTEILYFSAQVFSEAELGLRAR